jgi:four helix bundle protein
MRYNMKTEYWLRLLILSNYITEKEGTSLLNDCLEIKRILISSLNTAKENK